MNFLQEQKPDGLTLTLTGSFTFKDHHSFRALVDLLKASGGRRHVLDLSGLEFLDSAALGMLMVAEDDLSTSGSVMALRRPTPSIARLLELSALDTVFTIDH